MLISYVAGEGVELTVNKKRDIKEVEPRSRRAQFMTEIIIETRSCA